MIFIDHQFPSIEQLNLPDGRRYKTPSGNIYPSVTTVLSSIENSYLDEWRAAVGNEVADKISRDAARKGSKIHEACEDYLHGRETKWGMFDGEIKKEFEVFIPFLQSIDEVHAIETRMFSDKIKIAGTVDLIARVNGELSIIDWKTSSRYKSKEDIPNYFMQMATYSLCFFEHTGIPISKMKIKMTVKDYGLLEFDEHVKDWIPKFIEVRKSFRDKFGY